MKPIDVLTSPWAIVPDKLGEITEIYATHLRGEKIDIAKLEARMGAPLQRKAQGYEVINGIALIGLDGVIAKRMNMFTQISGGASSELFARDVRMAADDSTVKAIVLMIDSPGGSVDGTQAAAAAVREAADTKPVVAWADGMMASAAYWIGAAADRVYVAGDTTFMGSIGVVSQHVDMSKYQEKLGIKTTEIYAGKYKRIASEYQPLTKEGKTYMQDMVDHLYSVFVAEVAKFRGVSEEQVVADMADGRIFIGQNAVRAGLADGVSTLEGLMDMLASGSYDMKRKKTRAAGAAAQTPEPIATADPAAGARAKTEADPIEPVKPPPKGVQPMDKATLQKDYPALFAEVAADGATAERQRIQDVEAQGMAGHEALIKTLKFDGKTTGPEAAVQVLAAHKAKLGAKASELAADANDLPAVPASTDTEAAKAAEAAANAALPLEERAKKTWDSNADIRTEFGTLERYVAYEKATAAGNVRVLAAKRAA